MNNQAVNKNILVLTKKKKILIKSKICYENLSQFLWLVVRKDFLYKKLQIFKLLVSDIFVIIITEDIDFKYINKSLNFSQEIQLQKNLFKTIKKNYIV